MTASSSDVTVHSTGLTTAVNLLEPIKKKFPLISYADLLQLASATAIEVVRPPFTLKRASSRDIQQKCFSVCFFMSPAAFMEG